MQNQRSSDHISRELKVLRIIERTPDLTQRQLALLVGISLGGLNHCLRGLMKKGAVKATNFARSRNKLGYIYVLTPQGVVRKAELTQQFLVRKLVEYEELHNEIETLKTEMSANRRDELICELDGIQPLRAGR